LAACSASDAPAEGHQAGKDWPAFLGNDQAWSYSPLDRINRDNVARLAPAWAFSTGTKGLGATPLVVDGIMYLVAPDNHLFALDAVTGKQIWSSPRPVPTGQIGGTGGSTGLAMGFGLIFLGTLDNHLVAVDAKTGRDVWDVQIEDYRTCKCTTSFSPILAGDKVVVGARGDVAHRGYITAYDAKTGKQAWRFWTVPAPGEKGGDTWPGDTW
jgi:alcohol dehydrogenase (cytochrome c)